MYDEKGRKAREQEAAAAGRQRQSGVVPSPTSCACGDASNSDSCRVIGSDTPRRRSRSKGKISALVTFRHLPRQAVAYERPRCRLRTYGIVAGGLKCIEPLRVEQAMIEAELDSRWA